MLPMGASGASVLVSELPDTLSLAYLRLRSRSDPGARVVNLACSKKQKKTATNVTVFFWRSVWYVN